MDLLKPELNSVLEFLCNFDTSASYSSLNTARSSLAHLFQYTEFSGIFSDPVLLNFMKGSCKQRPSARNNVAVWNPCILLNHLKTMPTTTFEEINMKCVTLLKICSMQRSHTLTLIDKDNVHFLNDDSEVVIFIFEHLKVRRNRPSFTCKFNRFSDPDLCVVQCLKKLIQLSPSTSKLFVSVRKPHKQVTSDTISRWVKCVMNKAGIDTAVFTAHSTRSASTSTAVAGIGIDDVLKLADWSSEKTFKKFYFGPVLEGDALDLFTSLCKGKD